MKPTRVKARLVIGSYGTHTQGYFIMATAKSNTLTSEEIIAVSEGEVTLEILDARVTTAEEKADFNGVLTEYTAASAKVVRNEKAVQTSRTKLSQNTRKLAASIFAVLNFLNEDKITAKMAVKLFRSKLGADKKQKGVLPYKTAAAIFEAYNRNSDEVSKLQNYDECLDLLQKNDVSSVRNLDAFGKPAVSNTTKAGQGKTSNTAAPKAPKVSQFNANQKKVLKALKEYAQLQGIDVADKVVDDSLKRIVNTITA